MELKKKANGVQWGDTYDYPAVRATALNVPKKCCGAMCRWGGGEYSLCCIHFGRRFIADDGCDVCAARAKRQGR